MSKKNNCPRCLGSLKNPGKSLRDKETDICKRCCEDEKLIDDGLTTDKYKLSLDEIFVQKVKSKKKLILS